MPEKDTVLHCLSRKTKEDYGFFKTVLVGITRMGIVTGATEYLIYDGDCLTVFGMLDYSPSQNKVLLDAEYITSSGYANFLDYLKDKTKFNDIIFCGGLFAVLAAFTGYFSYRFIRRRYYNQQ